ncbi:MAG: hypothetical protein IJT43_07280 [Stomatobaculum sp.]|nr:hypothetical protein [Stomatobaculum sp.]
MKKITLLTAIAVIVSCGTAYAGQWKLDSTGWWYQRDDGSYPANQWEWIDGNKDGTAECYYFYGDGYMAYNNVIDGSYVNGDGQWVENGRVMTKAVGTSSSSGAPAVSVEPYRQLIMNKSLIESNDYFSYLKFYFDYGNYYGFQKYFLHDFNGDGTPELMVYSTGMGLTAVYSIVNQTAILSGYDEIYGFNPATGEMIVHGHWHGAGGSWDNEWYVHTLENGELKAIGGYDYFENRYGDGRNSYTYWDAVNQRSIELTREQYEQGLKDHVAGCRLFGTFKLYDLGDLSGLGDIQ